MVTSAFSCHLQSDMALEGKLRSEGHSQPLASLSAHKARLVCKNHTILEGVDPVTLFKPQVAIRGWLTQRVTFVSLHVGWGGASPAI